jgi:phosphotransferase system enzyme I (PtsP)
MVHSWRQIVAEVNATPSLHDVLALIVRRVKQSLPVDACAVYLADPASEQYVLTTAEGLSPSLASTVRVGDTGLVGLTAERRELVVEANAAAHPSFRSSPEPGQEEHGSFLGMPLIHYRKVLGVLVAWKGRHGHFDEEEVIFFVTISAH